MKAAAYGDDTRAHTEGQGVTIVFVQDRPGHATAHGDSGGCDWEAAPFIGTGPYGDNAIQLQAGPKPSEQHELYLAWCGEDATFMWLGPNNFAENAVLPRIDEVIERVTATPGTVTVRPDSRGITGIPSKFWVDATQPPPETFAFFGLTVTVNVQPVEVEWDFGDGGKAQAQSFSEDTAVLHPYRNTSGGQPYTVTATLLFQPTYTVNGVAGPALDPIQIPVTRPYVVHQVQAQRVR